MRLLRRMRYRFVEEAAASRGDFETARYYLAKGEEAGREGSTDERDS